MWLCVPPIPVQTQSLHRPGCLRCWTRWSTCLLVPLRCRTQQSCAFLDYRTKYIGSNIEKSNASKADFTNGELEKLLTTTATSEMLWNVNSMTQSATESPKQNVKKMATKPPSPLPLSSPCWGWLNMLVDRSSLPDRVWPSGSMRSNPGGRLISSFH